ncbi:MAG: N-acyl homoserine lactonase family protein [Cyclobacteriaceae bacterium]|nr:N-acyl homoserine lactonase family protein [Cyclobacteriaceae bacterium]
MKLFFYLLMLSLFFTFSLCSGPKSHEEDTAESTEEIRELSPLTLYAFEVGDILIKDISIFNPGVDEGQQAQFTNSAYLIKHDKGTLIWDTGLPDALADTPEGNDAPGFLMKMPKRLSDQLAEINVDPQTIDYLAVSHEHGDHIGNMGMFTTATILLQEEEYISLFENEERPASALDSLKGNAYVKLKDDHDVFGDGSVMIIRAPGHTAGHQVLYVNLPETGPVVLSGDLYHFSKNRELKGVPSFNSDKEQTLASMEMVEKFLVDNNATLWIQHEMQHEGVKWSPEFYR